MNRLAREKSPYLAHAAGQPIDWYPWGEEAFRIAAAQDKPVFLSSGAVWCHWCHVMASESFEDREVAEILNRSFISVKLDRDERPDIDRRYQQAAAISGAGGGWPLTAFLTPDKQPFFVGTYFPPLDSYGRPGFKRLLETIARLYRTKRDEIEGYGRRLMEAMRVKEEAGGEIGPHLLDEAAGLMLAQYDSKNGGFGTSPKFPMCGALEFLMERYALTGNGILAAAVRTTLDNMAKGGFHDQLGGGFHRYSVDESWTVPHFEKMADDNAWLLRNYAHAYALFHDERFRSTAEGIIRFVREVLSDPGGGFYASQDADVTPDDEGGYFTWTEDDLARVLPDDEQRVLSLHLLGRDGSVHHDPRKKVLLVSKTPEEIARQLDMEPAAVQTLIERGKARLLGERRTRKEPFVDRTLYSSLNGMLITSFLRASRAFRMKEVEAFALASLRRILDERMVGESLFHTKEVPGLLDDYIYLAEALLEAHETTGERSRLNEAARLMDLALERFWDKGRGGFFDTTEEVLGARLKTAEDSPHPSANATAIMLLVKLSATLKREGYRDLAEKALKAFIPSVRKIAVHAGYFFASLDAFYHLLSLDVGAEAAPELIDACLASIMPYTALSRTPKEASVVPCFGTVCFDPIDDAAQARDFLETRPYVGAK